ncbi:MAG: polysaccharide biosynthesis/export family protein [Proteobacteria bacterium]|nr:polysaccharide biosynthesis/export family protein [Pseudomonadota bacterium]
MIYKLTLNYLAVIFVSCFHVATVFAQEKEQTSTQIPLFGDVSTGAEDSSSEEVIQPLPVGGNLSLGQTGTPATAIRSDRVPPQLGNQTSKSLMPFGSQLFTRSNLIDRNIGITDEYVISEGDRIAIKVWGARNYDQIQFVDLQGNIFLPEVGPIKVSGTKNNELNELVKRNVAKTFTDNVQIYTNLLGTQPIGVYVTGGVQVPGKYPGGKTDSILYYLARAGAIDPDRGSYRSIRILRDGKTIEEIDLYRFLLDGELTKIGFKDNDTIIVDPQFPTISVSGDVKNAFRFEVEIDPVSSQALLEMARPDDNASHAFLRTKRGDRSNTSYMPLDQIAKLAVQGDDEITVVEDHSETSIIVNVTGNSGGPSSFAVPLGTDIVTAARLIEIDTDIANTSAIYLRRQSVAERQKQAIQRALYELQRSVLTGSSTTPTEAAIRVQEAKLVDSFVSKVMAIEPEGRVVLAGTDWRQTRLEDGDEIVIPAFSDIVLISGEVKIPQTVIWHDSFSLEDYISAAGGVSNRGDADNILIIRSNGSIHDGSQNVEKGDHIMVLPKQDGKLFGILKDLFEIIFRVAVSGAVVINAFD